MMTPMHTDLMKYSAPTAPNEQERQALRACRQARRAAFSTFIEKVSLHVSHFSVALKRLRVNSQF